MRKELFALFLVGLTLALGVNTNILYAVPVSDVLPAITEIGDYSNHDVVITSTKVTSTSKCSCGRREYKDHRVSFRNYCPFCQKMSILKFNPKNVLEGEWTCGQCSADFCAVCGFEKRNPSRKQLLDRQEIW